MNEYNDKDLSKINFIYKAIEDGWSIKKINNTYIFKKRHENKKKYISEEFLRKFILKYNK